MKVLRVLLSGMLFTASSVLRFVAAALLLFALVLFALVGARARPTVNEDGPFLISKELGDPPSS